MTQVLISKYCDRQPLYHQQQVLARAGVELPVSTQAGWLGVADVTYAKCSPGSVLHKAKYVLSH